MTDETNNNIIHEKKPKELHPCQYCDALCYGKQCKDCHFKMLETQKGICLDCHKTFHAIRKNGSKRRRCLECQEAYNKKYIAECPECLNTYHAFMEDGRVFEKCFNCYKKTLHKCSNCDNFTKFEYALCRNCYQTRKFSGHHTTTSPREISFNL
jgi:hypothetical protein